MKSMVVYVFNDRGISCLCFFSKVNKESVILFFLEHNRKWLTAFSLGSIYAPVIRKGVTQIFFGNQSIFAFKFQRVLLNSELSAW